MAVQGKLVPQDPNDEPASVLIQRIREEKEKLIKEKKIKKEKNPSYIFRGSDNLHYEKIGDAEPVCIEEQLPFEIPDSWQWVRLNSIVSKEIKRGKSPKYADHGEHYVFAQKCNVKTGGINMSLAKYLSDDAFQKYPTDEYMLDSDIIVNSTGNGTLGRIGIFHDSDRISNGEIVPDSHVTIVRTVAEVNTSFVYYTLKYYQPFLEKQGDGSTNQTELKPVTIASLLIPLPPIEEQNRVVSKLGVAIPHIKSYDIKNDAITELNKMFPEQLKKSILQEAVQGKLVPQDPSDEPASILLEKIAKEKEKLIKEGKIKKEKSLPTITEDEIPFDIPNSWKWTRIGELFQHNTGKALNGSNKVGNVMTYITTSNLYWNNFKIDNLKSMPFREDELKKYTITKGDLLVCEGGDYGRTAIWNFDYDIRFQNHIHRLRAYLPLCTKYFYYVMYFLKTSDLINGKGITIQGLSSGTLHNLIIPLPPLEEQKRIVAKIEELMPLIDDFNKA